MNGSFDEVTRLLEEDDGIQVDCSGSLWSCFLWTLQSFFNGSDDTSTVLDVVFGVVAIVICKYHKYINFLFIQYQEYMKPHLSSFAFTVVLNVVIAIVGDAWDNATEKASTLYWSFRVGYILQTRISGVGKKKLDRMCKGIGSLANLIDEMPNVKIRDDVVWSKGYYTKVTSSGHYFNPELYFIDDDITRVKNARSLQADIYWAGRQAEEEYRGVKDASGTAVQLDALKNAGYYTFIFFIRFILYAILIVLGAVTAGFFWPRNFRKGILTLGVEQTKTIPEPESESKPKGVEELAIESKKAPNDDTNGETPVVHEVV